MPSNLSKAQQRYREEMNNLFMQVTRDKTGEITVVGEPPVDVVIPRQRNQNLANWT